MKNLIILIILLMASVCFAQTITVDPNSIVEAKGIVTVNIKLTITADEYGAMQDRNLTFADMLKKARVLRYFSQLLADVKRTITEKIPLTELKKLEK